MKILIVDDIHSILLSKLAEAGFTLDYRPKIQKEEVMLLLPDYQGLVIRSKFQVDQQVMQIAPGLTFIARAGAGMDNIDEAYAAKAGITLINAPEGNRQAVAEHMMGMLLGLLNNLRKSQREIEGEQWLRAANRGWQLKGKTVGLIGYGHNGQAMAKCLSGFQVNVLVYDKYRTQYSDAYATEASMQQLFQQSDILSLHIPLTSETRGLVNAEFLQHFEKPIFFLNGARGEIVNIEDVLQALDTGKIQAAAFDVLPVEQFPELSEQSWFPTLVNHPNVMLSPHVAGWTFESYYDIARVLAEKIIAFSQA